MAATAIVVALGKQNSNPQLADQVLNLVRVEELQELVARRAHALDTR